MPRGNKIQIEMTADEARVLAALQKMTQGAAGVERGLSGAAKEARELERDAKRVWEQTRTPLERHNQELERLRMLLNKGKIGQEEYRRAVKNSEVELKRAGKAQMGAFGPAALAQVSSMITGMVSFSTVLQGITAELQRQSEIREAAGQRARAARTGLSSLAQVAETGEEFQDLVGIARGIRESGGAETEGEAASIVFSLKSAGVLGDRKIFSDLRSRGVVSDTATLARSVNTLITAIGKEETGNAEAIISKGFAASAGAPSTVPELLEAAARSGGSARALGISDEEVLAAVAITANATGQAAVGGTQLASLLKSFDKRGQKGSLRDLVTGTAAKNLSGEELFKFFGRQEAVAAFRTLENNLDTFDTGLEAVRAAERDNLVRTRLGFTDLDPQIAASRQAVAAGARLELSRGGRFASGNELATALDAEIERIEEESGVPGATRFLTRQGRRLGRATGGDDFFLRRQLEIAGQDGIRGDLNQELLGKIEAHLARISDTAERSSVTNSPTDTQTHVNER